MERATYDDEIDLRVYLEVIIKRWRAIALLAVMFAAGAFFFSLIQEPVYEAKATFLIRSNNGGGGLGQLSGLAGLGGLSVAANNEIGDLTTVMLSNAVALKVADDLQLRSRIKDGDAPGLSDDQFASMVKGLIGKPRVQGNLVEIKISYSDPALAAEIANGYMAALSSFWNKLNYTANSKKREYIEGQLPRVEAELRAAEKKLKQFTLLSPNSGSNADISGASASSLQGIETARLARELGIQSSVYGLLRTQYEQVKLEESKDLPAFVVIDQAVKPLAKSRPRTKLNVLIGMVLGLFAGIFIAFVLEYWEKSRTKR